MEPQAKAHERTLRRAAETRTEAETEAETGKGFMRSMLLAVSHRTGICCPANYTVRHPVHIHSLTSSLTHAIDPNDRMTEMTDADATLSSWTRSFPVRVRSGARNKKEKKKRGAQDA